MKFGFFVLKSGRSSPYFLMQDYFPLENPSKCLKWRMLPPSCPRYTLAAVVSSALYAKSDVNVDYADTLKEAKDHGERGFLVGASMKNQ